MLHERDLGPHVAVLVGPQRGKYPDGNTVVVRGAESSMVIDPSLSSRAAELEVDVVALTHAHEDHVAGVSAIRYDQLLVHEADVAAVRDTDELMRLYGLPPADWDPMLRIVREQFHYDGWPDAVGFAAGHVFDLGGVTVRAVHAPGHTAGHTVYLIEPDGVLVTGDIDLSTFGPYYGDVASSLDDFETSLAMVEHVEARHYVTYHHKGVVEGHAEFVAAVRRYSAAIERRTRALLTLLDEPRHLDELVHHGIVYRAGTRPPLFGDSVERHTIEQHLERLERDGAVDVVTDGRYRRLIAP